MAAAASELRPLAPCVDAPPTDLGLARLIIAAQSGGAAVPPPSIALAVRGLAEQVAELRPGRTTELRIPPYAAVQLGDEGGAGPAHTRGTPPSVVETDPSTFLRLALGQLSWADACATHAVRASGIHADLDDVFPLR